MKAAERRRAIEERRPYYQSLVAGGLAPLFEDARADCPLCGGRVRGFLRAPDRYQRKPGRFQLDECRSCGLVFQNPRLSDRGLEYYYGDFYEGLGSDQAKMIYQSGEHGKRIHAQARRVEGSVVPRRWLDVGGGNGSFCRAAAQVWPDARFEVLDTSSQVHDALARGWAAEVHQGLLTDLAPSLEGRYDVVTMHHYMEHTVDPDAEVEAVRRILSPGGVLVIEVPDPECRYLRLVKSYAIGWFQPQHLYLLPGSAMTALVERHGFTLLRLDRAAAHIPGDFLGSTFLAVVGLTPEQVAPWNAVRGGWREIVGALILVACIPLFVAAFVADLVFAPLARRVRRFTNVYVLIARRD